MRVVTLLLVFALSSFGAEQWIKLTTSHSEIYCSASEQVGQDSLARLEQLTSFFGELPEFTAKGNAPIRVVRFSSDEQFTPYKAYEWEGGHYEQNGGRDWVLVGPARGLQVTSHELVHLAVHRAEFQLPPWLDEGLADLFSTVDVSGGTTIVGVPPADRMAVLNAGKWVDLPGLISLDQKGYEALKTADVPIFYAESWALTHMLYLAPEYAPEFPKLLAALNHSKSPGDVFQQIYHKSPDAIYTDLKNYVAQKAVGRKEFPAPDVAKREVTVSPVNVFVSDLVKADLLSVMSGEEKKAAAARTAFEQLQRDYSAVAEIQRLPAADGPEVAGLFIQLAADGWDSRRSNPELLTAVEGITQLPQIQQAQPNQADSLAEMYFRVGLLERTAKQPASKAAEPLKKAVALRPDYPAARVQLGDVYVEMKDFPAAIQEYQLIPKNSLLATRALNGILAVAASYMDADKLDDAMKTGSDARPWAHEGSDFAQINNLLVFAGQKRAHELLRSGYLEEATKAIEGYRTLVKTAGDAAELDQMDRLIKARGTGRYAARAGEKVLRAEGTAQALDCPAEGPLLRVEVAGSEMLFDLPDPSLVEATSSGAQQVEINCGRLKPFHIVVDYSPPGVASKASAGIIRQMAF